MPGCDENARLIAMIGEATVMVMINGNHDGNNTTADRNICGVRHLKVSHVIVVIVSITSHIIAMFSSISNKASVSSCMRCCFSTLQHNQ